jgi:hypothetical protein
MWRGGVVADTPPWPVLRTHSKPAPNASSHDAGAIHPALASQRHSVADSQGQHPRASQWFKPNCSPRTCLPVWTVVRSAPRFVRRTRPTEHQSGSRATGDGAFHQWSDRGVVPNSSGLVHPELRPQPSFRMRWRLRFSVVIRTKLNLMVRPNDLHEARSGSFRFAGKATTGGPRPCVTAALQCGNQTGSALELAQPARRMRIS